MGCLALLFALSASADPGLTPATTWVHDTRASAIGVVGSSVRTPGSAGQVLSYLTTFTSTQSTVTANFGVHYLRVVAGDETAHGFSASSYTVFSRALSRRYANGVPTTQWLIAPGVIPTALLGRRSVRFDAPLVLRTGLAIAPVSGFSVVPWAEGGVNPSMGGAVDDSSLDELTPPTATDSPVPDAPGELSDVLTYDFGIRPFARAGLSLTAHLARFDLSVHGALGSVQGPEGTAAALTGGASVVWRWDRVVPAVLPPVSCPMPEPPPLDALSCPEELAPPAPLVAPALEPAPAPEPVAPAPAEPEPTEPTVEPTEEPAPEPTEAPPG